MHWRGAPSRSFFNPTGHHVASWRHPGAQADAGINFKHYIEIAQTAERGKFDMIFLADNVACARPRWRRSSRSAQYIANFEPITLISALAAVTERIGLTCTASTSYNEPFHVARKFASLDHISGGRAGWNLVTSGRRPRPTTSAATPTTAMPSATSAPTNSPRS